MYLLVLAVLPVYLLCAYVYAKDKEKESKKLLRKLFLFGMLTIIVAVILELLLGLIFKAEDNSNYIIQFISIFISIGFIEEICKWTVLRIGAFNNKEFNHIYDMIVYSVNVSLGFAVLENILYVLSSGFATGIVRALISVPGHACFAIFMGYYLGLAKINQVNDLKNKYMKNIILSILSPTLIHSIFDFLLLSKSNLNIVIFLVFLILIYILCLKKIKILSSVSSNFKEIPHNNYCTNCGSPLIGRYCTKCGSDCLK
jgi:RsiW-degrading membrane proteinase PrsW (M82 family)